MSIVYPDQYRIVVHPDKIVWSTIIVWSCALVAGTKITALEVGRTFTVSDATSSVVVAIAVVARISASRRPLSPSVVGRAAARLVVVVVEATVVAVVASVGKVAAGSAGATAALCKIPVISALAPVTAPPTMANTRTATTIARDLMVATVRPH